MSLPESASSTSSSRARFRLRGAHAGLRGARAAIMLIVTAAFVHAGCRSAAQLVAVDVAGHRFRVEVARTPEQRRVGLMNRASIPEDGGMLFVFPDSDYRSFWMRDTRIPLSIAFISAEGVIQEIYDMEPFSLERVESRMPARFALEVRRGAFAERRIVPGDRIRLPDGISGD